MRRAGLEGDRVAAGFGQEVAAVAEHVRPAAQRLEVRVGVGAEFPAGADEPALVGGGCRVVADGVRGDPDGGEPGWLGGLGGVFGEVSGDLPGADVAIWGDAHRPCVEL